MEEMFEILGIKPKDLKLYNTAFLHSSYANEHKAKSDYERLEFLGDSVVDLAVADYLYSCENEDEGEMTKVRANVVCEDSLYEIAKRHNFSDFLLLGKSEKHSQNSKKAIMADSVEAVIAAIFLDSDVEYAKKFIIDNLKDFVEIASKNVGMKDYKTVLQEKLQVHGEVKIKYVVLKEEGPDHDKTFIVEVSCDDKFLATGKGKNKKHAEMEAAKNALQIL